MWMHLDIHAGGLMSRRAFLGAGALSMAGWNAMASLAFAGLGALAWRWEGKSP